MSQFNTQVTKEHYSKGYDDLPRFISYFLQINLTRNQNPDKILEIGIGNKTVSNYFKQNGFNIETCDFDKELKPDYVADIRDLPFDDNTYDVVIACEILEHIPWGDVEIALKELHRISNKLIILSLPYASTSFEFIVRFPLIQNIFKRDYLSLFFRIPIFSFHKHKFNGEHYWEIGKRGYSIWRVRKKINKYFKILVETKPIINPFHYFFVLEKINESDNIE